MIACGGRDAMKDDRSATLVLGSDKVQFLEEMAKAHGLPDIGKAVRCLIDWAREHPDQQKDIFDELRCLDC
jgi:hypothetical protein